MAYTKNTPWQNSPTATTPVSASRLNNLETQYDEAMEDVKLELLDPETEIGANAETRARAAVLADIQDPESDIAIQQAATFAVGIAGDDYVEGMTPREAVEAVAPGGPSIQSNTIIAFGTSLENQIGAPFDTLDPVAGTYGSVRGSLNWANAFLGDQLTFVRNAGIGGNTYAQMLARITTDVLAYDSDWVLIGGPVNDIIQARTAAAIIADATAILDALSGRRVVMLTATATVQYTTTGMKSVLAEVNAWIKALPRTRPNIVVADAWAVLADKSTGSAATGMTLAGSSGSPTDTLHWSAAGALRVGLAIADVMRPHLSSTPKPRSYNGDPLSVIANPSFSGGTGWTDAAPSGTVAFGTDDNFGGKATVTIAGATTSAQENIQYAENISGGRFAAGDVVQASVRMKWSSLVPVGVASSLLPILWVWMRSVDNSWAKQISTMFTSSSEHVVPTGIPASGDIVLRSPRITVPSPTSPVDRIYIYMGLQGAASGVVEFTELAVLKVSP